MTELRPRGDFEERYLDVLQNIESAIAGVFRAHRELADFQARAGLEWALRVYTAAERGRAAPPEPPGLPGEVGRAVKAVCDWRLGAGERLDESGRPAPAPPLLARDEIIACLKRLRRSLDFWTRAGGRQGYLTYIEELLP